MRVLLLLLFLGYMIAIHVLELSRWWFAPVLLWVAVEFWRMYRWAWPSHAEPSVQELGDHQSDWR